MPFVEIDWNRFGNNNQMTIDPLSRLDGLQKPCKLAWRVLGLDVTYPRPKKKFMFVLSVGHYTAVTLIFCTLLSLALATTALRSHVESVPLFYCLLSVATGLYWSICGHVATFRELLGSATTGVAINKHPNCVRYTLYTLSTLFVLIAVIWVSYGVYKILPDFETSVNFTQTQDLGMLDYMLCGGGAYLWIAWACVHVTPLAMLIVLAVELHNTNADLKQDMNAYQTPVINHYIYIHHNLSKLVRHVDKMISIGIVGVDTTAVIFMNILLIIQGLSKTDNFILLFAGYKSQDLNALVFYWNIMMIISVALSLGVFIGLQLIVLAIAKNFEKIIGNLTSGDKRLDVEVHAASLSYLWQVGSRPLTFTFAHVIRITPSNLVKILISMVIVFLQVKILVQK